MASGGELSEFSKAGSISSPFSASTGGSRRSSKYNPAAPATPASSGGSSGGGLKQWSFPRGWRLKVQAEDLIPYPYRENCIKLRTNHISVYENMTDGSVEFTFTEASKTPTREKDGEDAGPVRGGGTYVITKNMMKRFMNAKNEKIAKEFNTFVGLYTNSSEKAKGSASSVAAAEPVAPVSRLSPLTEKKATTVTIQPPEKKKARRDIDGDEEMTQVLAAKKNQKSKKKQCCDQDSAMCCEEDKEKEGNNKKPTPAASTASQTKKPTKNVQQQGTNGEDTRKDAVPFPLLVIVDNHADMVKMAPTESDRQFLRTMASNPLSNTFEMSGSEVRVELNRQFSEQKMASRSVIPRIGMVSCG